MLCRKSQEIRRFPRIFPSIRKIAGRTIFRTVPVDKTARPCYNDRTRVWRNWQTHKI